MKILYKFRFLFLLGALLVACNDSPKKQETKPIEQTEIKKPELPSTLYVIAPSGLILRETADLDGKRIDKMAYGTKVDILSDQNINNLEVANIPGTMLKVKYRGTIGFAYSGYLTQFSAPQNGENANQYAQRLKTDFPSVNFTTDTKSTEGKTSKLILNLPARSWSEAYLIAKQLYNFPSTFDFPKISGPEESIVKGTPTRKNIVVSSLHIKRNGNALSEISYQEKGKNYSREVQIVQKEDQFVITEQITD